jgi:hypothetical protein
VTDDIIEVLNVRVTEAIRRAERLRDEGSPHAAAAYAEVSSYEEALAALLPADDLEGAAARVGAVAAALQAKDPARASVLARSFLRAPALAKERREELRAAQATADPHQVEPLLRWRDDLRRHFLEAA